MSDTILIKLDKPNVFVEAEFDSGLKTAGDFEPDAKMEQLIDRASVKFPNYKFVYKNAHNFNTSPTVYTSTDVDIVSKGQYIGELRRQYHRGGRKYTVYNANISSTLSKGIRKGSEDINKVIALIKKYCYPKKDSVLARESYRSISDMRMALTSRAVRTTNEAMGEVFNAIKVESVVKNEGLMYEIATTLIPSPTDTQLNVVEVCREQVKRQALMTDLADRGSRICILDGMYHIDTEENPVTVLPEKYKLPVGLLKLGPKNKVVDGVGFRLSDTEYYVLPKEEEDADSKDA